MARTPKTPRSTPTIRKLRDALAELAADTDRLLTGGQILRGLSPRFRTLGRSLLWLAAYDADESTRERACKLLVSALREPGVPAKVREKVVGQAAELAETVIRDSSLDDERKLIVSMVITLSGSEMDEAELQACFVDFAGSLERVAREVASTLLDSVAQVESWLQAAELAGGAAGGGISEEQLVRTLAMAALMAETQPRVGATAMAVVAAIGHETCRSREAEWCLALDAVAKLDPERALALLTELSTWPNTGALGAKARGLSMRLRAEGVSPHPLPTPVFSHGLVSMVDGSGSRALQLHYHQGQGTRDALCLVLNDRVGLKDVWCAFGDGHEAEQQFRSAGLPLASCDGTFARELIADTLATHEVSGRPVPGRWLLYRAFLGAGPLEPTRRTPNLGAYALETVARRPELAEHSETLLLSSAYDQLGFDSDAAYAFVREQTRGRKGALRISRELVVEFLEAIEGHERERLTRRLAVNLEHEARAGRAKQPLNRLASRVWIALSEGLLPFNQVPYAQALAIQSLEAIAENVALGHRTQDEANHASLESDPALPDMLIELAGLADR